MVQLGPLFGVVPLLLWCLAGLALHCRGARPAHLVQLHGHQGEVRAKRVPGVCLGVWDGRFGNQVIMLQQALEAARLLDMRVLRLPREDGTTVRKVLRLEDNVWSLGTSLLESQDSDDFEVECVAFCAEWETCRFANHTRIDMPRAGQTAEPELLRHLLTEHGRLRCDELGDFRHGDNNTLTMHMRAGDVLEMPYQPSGYHKLAPCEFWVQAFKHGHYSSALIVTERDQRHPCINVVQEAFPGKVQVQTSSELEDFCAIMNSHSLAVSFSTLGSTLVELSPTLRTVYAPTWVTSMVFDRSNLLEKCVEVHFPGYPERFESWPQKRSYLLSFPAKDVSIEARPCRSVAGAA